MSILRYVRSRALSIAGASLLLIVALAPASAHVGVKADTSAAGSIAIVTFGFGHGCGDSPTTALVFQIPEQFNSVAPVFAAGWSIDVEKQGLDEPIEGSHGSTITERTSTVTFNADAPIEDGIYAMVSLRLTLPEDAAGESIYFPVIQECEEGENAWIEIPQDGEDEDDLESPAPALKVTDADDDSGH